MREAIKKNKKYIIIGLVIIILLLIGLAFAYLVTTLQGDKEYLVRAGTLDLVLDEGNELTLERQIPLSDNEGLNLDGFNFSLVNNGSIDTDYTIYLDDMELSEGESRIPDSSIRYSLTRNDETFMTRNMTTMGSNPNRRVDFGTISKDETINYTLRIWIDYDATTEEASGKVFKGKLRVEGSQSVGEPVADVLLADSSNNINTDNPEQTFITGENPNNYIWYSGKLWRAVSINPTDNSVKLVTQWNISSIPYNEANNTNFAGSYMEEWLNDTSVDGFLGNLRDYERYIKLDNKWNATMMSDTSKPPKTTIVEDPVGLLNLYEYTMSYTGTTYQNGYLNNGLTWWTLTPYDSLHIWRIERAGASGYVLIPNYAAGIRPSINLKRDVKIVSGNGTEEDPYRLLGDNDEENNGIYLNTRYSGEYIRFGTGENNLYQIVSHETRGLTKISSVAPLKEDNAFKKVLFDINNNANYSINTTIGNFLNNDYLNVSNGYLSNKQINMIEDSTTWYLGVVQNGFDYRLSKYENINMMNTVLNITESKVGLLRLGELMAGQFDYYNNNSGYWLLTPYLKNQGVWKMHTIGGYTFDEGSSVIEYGIKPTLNLKSNVIITSGDGTKENPFNLELAS